MTDPTPATVAVPVELLKRLMAAAATFEEADSTAVERASALIPKPKSRLRLVDFDELLANQPGEGLSEYLRDLATQPDLLTLLDEVLDDAAKDNVIRYPKTVKLRIRAALGVTE